MTWKVANVSRSYVLGLRSMVYGLRFLGCVGHWDQCRIFEGKVDFVKSKLNFLKNKLEFFK